MAIVRHDRQIEREKETGQIVLFARRLNRILLIIRRLFPRVSRGRTNERTNE